jgi:uncharacterized RDD family membrane protein YckC
LIDGAISLILGFLALAVISAAIGSSGSSDGSGPSGPAEEVIVGLIVWAFFWSIANVPVTIYMGGLNGTRQGQTLGKKAVGISVRDELTGKPIGFWRGVGRHGFIVLFGILVLPLIVDLFRPLWGPRRQSWHDAWAHTVVVKVPSDRRR